MSVTFDPRAGQVSPLRSFQYIKAEEKPAKTGGQSQDQLDISAEGRQAAAPFGLNGMTADEYMTKVREQLGEQQLGEQQLEVNWNATVDPDGQIWCKAYFESYVSQAMEFKNTAESAIKDYYSDVYQEALNSSPSLPQQLNFITAKYLCSWSNCFDTTMPAAERQWAYTQLHAMLTGTGLRLNDPYALKGIHIPNVEETTQIARKTADDKINELVRQAKEANGITE